MVSLTTVQDTFVRQLPTLRKMARFYFRNLCPEARAEATANALGLAWKAYYRLYEKGRTEEPGILNCCMKYACKQTREGRSVAGCPRKKDVFNGRRTGRATFEELEPDQFVGRFTPVFDEVSFRIDVPAFLDTLPEKQRRMLVDLAGGLSTTDAAKRFDLSAGRISQIRRQLTDQLREFMTAH